MFGDLKTMNTSINCKIFEKFNFRILRLNRQWMAKSVPSLELDDNVRRSCVLKATGGLERWVGSDQIKDSYVEK